MNKKYDAIIIGAGVIGAPIAYELCQMGYKTLSIDKLSDAGAGSTAASCAIVRAHYSTEDGVAMAYEGFKYWLDWENYLGNVKDEKGLAKYMNTGSILIKSQGHDWRKVKTTTTPLESNMKNGTTIKSEKWYQYMICMKTGP